VASALVADIFAARCFELAAGVPPAPGAAVQLALSPGMYELRVIGGDVSITRGSVVSALDVRIAESSPCQCWIDTQARAASFDGQAAVLWAIPLRPVG
jgi:hypothetical protein